MPITHEKLKQYFTGWPRDIKSLAEELSAFRDELLRALSQTYPIPVAYGGTGTATAFTAGSIVFAGTSGIYTQDNANFFWNDSTNVLFLGGATAAAADMLLGADGSAIFNEQGADVDHRIEGDTATQLLVCDAGLDAVQIGTTVAGAIADFRNGAIVFNEDGEDRDVRVEGVLVPNLLVVDAGAKAVHVGTAAGIGYIASFGPTEISLNEGATDTDVRIESLLNAYMLLVDASAEGVLVGGAIDLSSVFGVHITTNTDKGIVVRGAGSQSGNLIEAQTDAGAIVAAVRPGAQIQIGTATPWRSDRGLFVTGSASDSLIGIEAGAVRMKLQSDGTNNFFGSESNHNFNFLTNNTQIAGFNTSGNFGVNILGASILGRVHIATSGTTKGLILKATSPSVNTIEVQDGSENVMFQVDKDGAFVANEQGADADSRIEGDTATSLLVCDAGLDAVQIGTTSAGVIADFRSATIVLNEDGADRDFRVESDNQTHAIFSDASADKVGFFQSAPAARVHITEPTIGNEVFRLESVATNDDPAIKIIQGRAATTDATVTTVATLAISASNTYQIQARVVARRTGGTAGSADDGASYLLIGTYKTVSGTVTLIGSVTTLYSAEDVAGWDCTLTISGTNVLVRFTGAADTNITVHAHVTLCNVGT